MEKGRGRGMSRKGEVRGGMADDEEGSPMARSGGGVGEMERERGRRGGKEWKGDREIRAWIVMGNN